MDYSTLILLLIPVLSIALLYLVPGIITFISPANKGIERKLSKHIALLSSLGSLGFLLYIFYYANGEGFVLCNCKDFQFTFNEVWVQQLGINLNFGIDGIGMLMLLLTNIAMPLIVLSAYGRAQAERRGLFALILLMQAALLGVFISLDSFMFYLFYEIALVPVFFIILHWGGENRAKINLKFFIYTMSGSLFMLLAIIYLYLQTGASHTFSIQTFYALQLTPDQQTFVFIAFMLAFAVKIPLFPFHSWQPATYTVAPTQGTMLLSGIMLKMALYGILRFVIPIAPWAVTEYGHIVIALAIIGVVYGGWIAINQNNMKTLFAFSSLSHVGLIAAGFFTLQPQAMQGGLFQMVAHGINAIGLFMVADIVSKRLNTLELSKMGGIVHKAPIFSILFFIIVLGAVALPLTNGFVGEFLLLLGIFAYSKVAAAIAGLTIIFGAIYLLNAYQKAMLGETNAETENFKDVSLTEGIVLFAVAVVVIGTGIFPEIFMNMTKAPVEHLFHYMQDAPTPTI